MFAIAGIYGNIVLLPFYFTEPLLVRLGEPPLTRLEHFYGFVGT